MAGFSSLYRLYARLVFEGRRAAHFRGHKMGNARLERHYNSRMECIKMTGNAKCKYCGFLMLIDTHPAPNNADITGMAVSCTCSENPDYLKRMKK